jgi:hypothetical protein
MEMLKAMQEKADTNRIVDREFMKQMMAKIESCGERIRAETEAIRAERRPSKQKRKPCETRGWKPKWTPTRRRRTANKRKCWPECKKIHKPCET